MVTIFDLVSGETEEFNLQTRGPAAQPVEPHTPVASAIVPRLQEHSFSEAAAQQHRDMPLELAQLDCEVFIRSMERD